MIRFVERKWWYFGLSLLLIVPGVIFLALGGLKPGIEFKGGTLLDARFDTPPTITEVRSVMSDLKHDEAIIQVAEGGRIEIRTFEMKPDEIVAAEAAIKAKFGASVKDISHEVNVNVQKGFESADLGEINNTIEDVNRQVQREIKKSYRASKQQGDADKLIRCIQRAHQNVNRIQRCSERFQ